MRQLLCIKERKPIPSDYVIRVINPEEGMYNKHSDMIFSIMEDENVHSWFTKFEVRCVNGELYWSGINPSVVNKIVNDDEQASLKEIWFTLLWCVDDETQAEMIEMMKEPK